MQYVDGFKGKSEPETMVLTTKKKGFSGSNFPLNQFYEYDIGVCLKMWHFRKNTVLIGKIMISPGI